jgi:hypothetical protein
MAEKIEREPRYMPQSVMERLLDALKLAAEALEEWHDETTLPYIQQVIRSVEENW